MLQRFFCLLLVLAFNPEAQAQVAKTSALFLTLQQQDSIFFERGFNQCDMAYLEKHVAQAFTFYHDKSGIQDRTAFFENTRKYICSNAEQKPIRKVDRNSLEVFPLYQDGHLYGAIQQGIHHFYIRSPHQQDVHTGTAKFSHVWVLENEQWILKEVLSFDHQEATPYKLLPIDTKAIEQLLQQEHVPAMGLGIIENGKLQRVQVFGHIDSGVIAPYNTIFKVASLTKPITALVALKLINAGQLGLDEPLSKYWIDPDLKGDKRLQKLTPRMVLSHQTGFPNWRFFTPANKLAFEFEPGTKFQYSGEGFEYLRKAIEIKFKQPLETLAKTLVFEPAHMQDTHFWWDSTMDEKRYAKNYDNEGKALPTEKYYKANAAANLLTTVADYGSFLAYMAQGAGLSAALWEEVNKAQVQLQENDYFGLGWEKLTGFSNGEYAMLHTGKDPGVHTLAIFFPQSKNGYLIFFNGDHTSTLFEKILSDHLYLGTEVWKRK